MPKKSKLIERYTREIERLEEKLAEAERNLADAQALPDDDPHGSPHDDEDDDLA